MNAYDAGRMADLLQTSHDLTVVDAPDFADLIILNTCHIREKAEEKIFSELGRLHKSAKRSAPDKRVIFAVGGCVGQAEGTGLFRRAPFVDMVFGPQNYRNSTPCPRPSVPGHRPRCRFRRVATASAPTASYPLPEVGSGAARWGR